MMDFLGQAGYVLIGVLLLGILVAVHEFGHFMAARLTGIEVMEFAVGMGPKIFGWTGKKGTKFSLRCIPFGGFCAFYGEDDVEGKSKDDPRAYNKQAVWKRMLTVAMGPVMNFVLALIVSVVFCWSTGVMTAYPAIVEVEENSPAYAGGLRAGDYVQQVDGVNVGAQVEDVMPSNVMDRLSAFQNTIAASEPGVEHVLTVLRPVEENGAIRVETAEVKVSAFWDEELQRSRIGIRYSIGVPLEERTHVGFLGGLRHGWNMCVTSGMAVFEALGKLFSDRQVLDSVSGPVGVVEMVSQSVQIGGLNAFISLLVIISVNLGIMNLLPIPGLDGARFLFHAIEGVRRKPVKPEVEGTIHLVGTLILLGLLLLLTFRDVWRLF